MIPQSAEEEEFTSLIGANYTANGNGNGHVMNYPTDKYYSDEAYDMEATHGISLSTNFEIRPNRL